MKRESRPRLDRRAIWAVVQRDLLVVRSSKPVIVPMIIVPVLLLVVLPSLLVAVIRLGADAFDAGGLERLLAGMPAGVAERVAADPVAGSIEVALVYLLSPFLLIIPLLTASVIAADAIAGERERRTLEGLLATPLTDAELLTAKFLGAWIPAVTVGIAGGVVYAVVGDLAAWGVIDGLLFPNVVWFGMVLWIGPAFAALSLGVTVVVSARVKTVQEAFQISGVIVVPAVVLLVGQAVGLIALSPVLIVGTGALTWAVALVVLRFGARAVRRTRLGERL